jgi:hypothetical protein
MEFLLITNDAAAARAAEHAGVSRVFVDLERLGKSARQRRQPLFLSTHTMDDVARMRDALQRASLMVRVDPPHDGTVEQVNRVIDLGADFVMLPYFSTLREATDFVAAVLPRAVPVLLIERVQVLAILHDVCRLPGVAEMHVGLNDLSLSMGRGSWFRLLTDPLLDATFATLRSAGRPFGFGGISSLSRTDLPVAPDLVLAEQVCQGATRGWLGRSFREAALGNIEREIEQLRAAVAFWAASDTAQRGEMRARLRRQVASNTERTARRVG